MNNLTNEIVKHIFSNFGLTNERAISIISEQFLTEYKVEYEVDEDDDEEAYLETSNVWAAEATASNVKINVICSKFGAYTNGGEYIIVIYIDNCPSYGCSLNLINQGDVWHANDGIIAFSMKDKGWIKADAYIQFTFAAGLENFKDLMISFDACKNPKFIYDKLISFIKYCDELEETI